MFGAFWCELMCEDDDDVTTTTTESSEDYWDVLLCAGCGTSRPRTTLAPPATFDATTPNPLTARPPSFNFVIPSGGMNMTMSQQTPGGGSIFSFIPWGSPQGAASPAAAAAAATTAAAPVATTAAAAATTAAAAETTAAGATTAAATTAAPAGK